MNAAPRVILNGLKVLRLIRRVQSLHQKLLEMTKKDLNAWSVYRSASPALDKWVQPNYGTDNLGRFSTRYICTENDSNTSSATRIPDIDLPKSSYSISCQVQPRARALRFQQGDTNMNHFGSSNPMLYNGYPELLPASEREIPTESLEKANGVREYQYQSARASDPEVFSPNPCSLIGEESSVVESSAAKDLDNLDRIRCFTTCTSSLTANLSVDPRALVSVNPPAWNEALDTNDWWPPSACNDGVQRLDIFEPLDQDSLPRLERNQLYDDCWTVGSRTISPEALVFESPPPAMSTSISSEDTSDFVSVSSTTCAITDDGGYRSRSETVANAEERTYSSRHQRVLPVALRISRNALPSLPIPKLQTRKSTKKHYLRPNSGGHSHNRTLIYESYSASSLAATVNNGLPLARLNMTEGDELILLNKDVHNIWANSSHSTATERAVAPRNAKDDFLVKSKLAGMSYKDIRRHGKFSEAESTLRGRFRTLTKHKTARVRKPEWEDNDIQLLMKAVRKLAKGPEATTSRIPWKQVAEYIADNGGSYHFGNATCRKKWDELEKHSAR